VLNINFLKRFNSKNREAKSIIDKAMLSLKTQKYKDAIKTITPLEEEINQDFSQYNKRIIQGIWYILANANQGLSNHKSAAEYFNLCLQSDTRNMELLYSSGMTHLALNDLEKARECLRALSKFHGINHPLAIQLDRSIKNYDH
jgi:tetratricopeptide (TPR) repeat protein